MTYVMRIWSFLFVLAFAAGAASALAQTVPPPASVEQWDIFDLPLKSTSQAPSNPYDDVKLSATFTNGTTKIPVTGFYDGDNTYHIRFSPPALGDWQYQTISSLSDLDGKTGHVQATKPSATNHGPVVVGKAPNLYSFYYADGTSYFPFGTTCYAWIHQGDALEEQTLASLKTSPFNKVRMCVFPKHMEYNNNEPVYYPFLETSDKKWDFSRFNPEFFHHLEKRIGQLRDMNIEADVILFHPYDRGQWGFDTMGAANDDRYLRYVLARLSCYRNVWWSLANEFDNMLRTKPMATWDHFFDIVTKEDPFGRLRSIHNNNIMYNLAAPYITHASVQNNEAVRDFGRAWLFRQTYRKPVIMDEVAYEGNIPARWGNLSAEEMTRRFWIGIVSGVYVTHGETYLDPSGNDVLWWAKGGTLHGKSPERIAFLRKIVEAGPPAGIDMIDKWEDDQLAGVAPRYYLRYFDKATPTEWTFDLPRTNMQAGLKFKVEVIDTWNMTITPVDQIYTTIQFNMYHYHAQGDATVKLPGKPYIAIRITPVN